MKSGYNLIYKSDDPSNFWKLFNLLKVNFKFIGYIYEPITLDWFFIKAKEFGFDVEDYSCIFTFDGEPYSVFIGARISKGNISSLSLFEAPCLALDSITLSAKKKKQVKIFLDNLLAQNFTDFQVKGPDFESRIPTLCEILLEKTNSKINPAITRIIDLTLDEIQLKKSIRKSYHSLINWGLNQMQIQVYDKDNINWEVIDNFRKLHIIESKRETRSINTWRKQFEAIQNGYAFCITAHLNNELVSSAYFLCTEKICYYGVSVSRRDLFSKPLSHALIWKAILESKRKGALLFNIGSTFDIKKGNSLTKKEKNIAYFKEGFGGYLVLNYVVENELNI